MGAPEVGRPMARLLLVDDHIAYREAFASVLERDAVLNVMAQAGTLADARERLPGIMERLDVALIGQDLPDGDGTELRPHLQALQPRCHLVVLRAGTGQRDRARAIAAGA